MITAVSSFEVVRYDKKKYSNEDSLNFHWSIHGYAFDILSGGIYDNLIMLKNIPYSFFNIGGDSIGTKVLNNVNLSGYIKPGKYIKRNQRNGPRPKQTDNIDHLIIRRKLDLVLQSLVKAAIEDIFIGVYGSLEPAKTRPIQAMHIKRIVISDKGEIVGFTVSLIGIVKWVFNDVNYFKGKLVEVVESIIESTNCKYDLGTDKKQILKRLNTGVIEGYIDELILMFVLSPIETQLLEINAI